MRKKKRPQPIWVRIVSGLGYVLFLSIALAGGTLVGVIKNNSLLNQVVHDRLFKPRPPQEVFNGKDGLTLLLLGCDEDRYFHGTYANGSNIRRKYARADMIMVMKLDFVNHQMTGVSVPRDTECKLPGFKHAYKVNAYHSIAKKGHENALEEQAVEHLLPGVDIDRVVVLDFDAMQRLVDAIGGVTVTVPKKMNYDDKAGDLHIHLQPGKQLLNGYQAMGYVRFRHDRESDFGRQARQKDFMVALKSSVQSQLLHNPFKVAEFADKGKSILNDALNDEEIASLITFMQSVPPTKIRLGMVPVADGTGTRLLLDEDKLPDVLQEYNLIPGNGTRVSAAR